MPINLEDTINTSHKGCKSLICQNSNLNESSLGFCRVNWSQLELLALPGILVKLSTWDRIYGRTLNLDHKTCKRWELLDAEVHVNEKWSAISASNSSNASQWINNNAETNMQPQQIAWTVDKPPSPPRGSLRPRQCQILAKYFELVTL